MITPILLILLLWALGFGFSVGGSLVHLLLVVVLVLGIIEMLNRRSVP